MSKYFAIRDGKLCVDLHYPRTEQEPKYIEVGLRDVRASDGIRISYDFARDGWVIEQAAYCDKTIPSVVLGPFDWKEVAFVESWAREADPTRVRIEDGSVTYCASAETGAVAFFTREEYDQITRVMVQGTLLPPGYLRPDAGITTAQEETPVASAQEQDEQENQ